MSDSEVYAMSPTEIALGFVFGHPAEIVVSPAERKDPRSALEDVIREHLQRPPCGVAFSGGRDSSAVLALTVHVARKDGFPDPIPITRVFESAPRAEEHKWQELVVRHLQVANWERLKFSDELDLVGPIAAQNLAYHGVIWSPLLHADIPLLEHVRGGGLLDGEGGDEVLGVRSHRIEPVHQILLGERTVSRTSVKAAAKALAPASLRARRTRWRAKQSAHEWLTPTGQAAWADAVAAIETRSRLSHSASVRQAAGTPGAILLVRNRAALARKRDVVTSSPFLRPEVVDALARQAGWLGLGTRTDVLRRIIPDLLPDAVLARDTKAEFGQAYFASHARSFVGCWDGGGVDPDLVDVDGLRREWQSERPSALTSSLLQAAWLAHNHKQRTVDAG